MKGKRGLVSEDRPGMGCVPTRWFPLPSTAVDVIPVVRPDEPEPDGALGEAATSIDADPVRCVGAVLLGGRLREFFFRRSGAAR